MKQLKRTLCLLLALVMLLALGPVSGFAEDVNETPDAGPVPVRVEFVCTPDTASVTVYGAETNEDGTPKAIEPAEDGSYLLLPGSYSYDAGCKGYIAVFGVPFTVAAPEDGESPVSVYVELEPVAIEAAMEKVLSLPDEDTEPPRSGVGPSVTGPENTEFTAEVITLSAEQTALLDAQIVEVERYAYTVKGALEITQSFGEDIPADTTLTLNWSLLSGLNAEGSYALYHLENGAAVKVATVTGGTDSVSFTVSSLSPFAVVELTEELPPLGDILVLNTSGASHTITFDPNGGSGTMPAQTVASGSTSEKLYANTFTREGFAFAGWGLEQYPERVYSAGQLLELTEDVTLYAIWDDAPEGYTNLFTSAAYGDTVATMESDGNGGWIITDFRTWAPSEYDPGSPTKIYIPKTYRGEPITAIGANAFNQKGIIAVTFAADSAITSIGNYAFYLDSISGALSLPVSLQDIGRYAFARNAITEVNFTQLTNLETIGSHGFYDNKIQSLDLSQTQVTELADYLFDGKVIRNPVLHPQTTSIGESALGYYSGTVRIPATVTTVGDGAFSFPQPNSLIDVSELPDAVIESIYPNLLGRYSDAISRTKIQFPTTWYDNDTDFVLHNGTIYEMKDSWAGGTITVPARDDVTSIAIGAFATRPAASKGLTSLVFADGCRVTALPNILCSLESELTSVSFHSGLTRIGTRAFYGCEGLSSVSFPEGLLTIGAQAFQLCNLTELSIPSSVTSVGTYAFANNTPLTTVTIGKPAAEGGTALTRAGLPASVFYGDGNVTDIYVPGIGIALSTTTRPWNLKPWGATAAAVHWADGTSGSSVEEYLDEDGGHWLYNESTHTLTDFLGKDVDGAFNDGKNAANRIDLTIPIRVYRPDDAEHSDPLPVNTLAQKLLGNRRDAAVRYFGTVTLPGSFGTAPESVFQGDGTFSIHTLVFEEGITSIGNHAAYNVGLRAVVLPDSLVSIGSAAFEWGSIRALTLPENLESIGSVAFAHNQIGRDSEGVLVIPASVRTLGSNFLYTNDYLTEIRFLQYLDPAAAPEGAAIADPAWEGNAFGAANVGNRVYFLDSITTEVEQVGEAVRHPEDQTITVIVRAKKDAGAAQLVSPFIVARNDSDIADFQLIAPDSPAWQADYDTDWVYATLTVRQDKTYYFDATFLKNGTVYPITAMLPITISGNFGTLKYDRNLGSGVIPAPVTKLIGTEITVEDSGDLARYGYLGGTFTEQDGWYQNGWNTAADRSGDDYFGGDTFTITAGTTTLYARWIPDPAKLYDVIYKVDLTQYGSVDPSSNQNIQVLETEGVTGSTASITQEAIDAGYHVDGWYVQSGNGTKIANGATLTPEAAIANLNMRTLEAYEETTFIANIALNTFTVKFNKNSGTGSMSNVTMTWGEETVLPANTFTRAGYVFTGWNTKANGSGTAYSDEEAITLYLNHGASITLYAQWMKNEFYIYHSSTCQKETISLPLETETFDLTAKVSDGYLYGGYYADYQKKGTNYVGGLGSWVKTKAYTANGSELVPTVGTTYYLKEVPVNSYLKPYLYVIFDRNNNNTVTRLLTITDVDDMNYSNIGLDLVDITTGNRLALSATFTITNTVSGQKIKLTTQQAFGVNGLMAVWETDGVPAANENFRYQAWYETPDGVKVYGNLERIVYMGDGTVYNGTFGEPGIHYTDLEK